MLLTEEKFDNDTRTSSSSSSSSSLVFLSYFCQLGDQAVSVRQYLSLEATKTLDSSLVLSRLDCCIAGSRQVLLLNKFED